jgi:amino acid transporter
VARPGLGEPTSAAGRFFANAKHLVLGAPIPTSREAHERLNKARALAVFSSDALSSVAYATEEIMKVLILAGAGLLSLTLPISLLIVAVLAIVVVSYRQTVQGYPSGGGSYIVASGNLGVLPGLTAASALLIDYVLTVSVSVAAGVAAVTSLVPELLDFALPLSIGAVLFIALANLRGLRESGTIFAVPTYGFLLVMYALVAFGLYRLATGGMEYVPPPSALEPGDQSFGLFLLMSAFAQGCTAMTGTEAISNGVPAFKAPEWRNARTTLLAMGLILGSMFLGVSFLAVHIGIIPATDETVLSQLGRTVFGLGPAWGLLQIATALILVLAANTSFADFPRLASILARDRFLPRVFQFRGDRLAFTSGIVALSALAIVLLVIFNGSLDQLIPLYAVGVFTSFTLSQAGMVIHWRRERGPNWRRSAMVNGVGAVATGIVTLIIASTKFAHGAWLVVLLIPIFIAMFRAIHLHYDRLQSARDGRGGSGPDDLERVTIRAVVPVAGLGAGDRRALAYARALAPDPHHVTAVHVVDNPAAAEEIQRQWDAASVGVELVIIESPFRSLIGPLIAYVEALEETFPTETVTVVVPETVPGEWWELFLHNHTALRLKLALLFKPGIVVVNVPLHFGAPAAA